MTRSARSHLDPAMAAIVVAPAPGAADFSIAAMRAQSKEAKAPFNARARAGLGVREGTVGGAEGERPMLILGDRRSARPGERARAEGAAPVVHIHGGGWSVGSPGDHLSLLAGLHRATGRTVLAPHPRQAPEHPFPAPLSDVAAILAALIAQHGPLHVSGDSAGAHLALAALLSGPGDTLAGVLSLSLAYGCFRPRFDTASHRLFGDGSVGLSTERMRVFWDRFDPERGSDLSRVSLDRLAQGPPVQLHAANVDVLRDDTLWLEARLFEAGCPAELHTWPGMAHGFLHYPEELEPARAAFATMAAFMTLAEGAA